MKKLLVMLLMFTLCISVNIVFADSFNVVVDNKTANTGETIDINISLENNSGIIAALFNVEYDKERLELIEVQDGRILDGGTFSPNYKSYPYKMVWNSATNTNFTENGVLAVLKFKVLENAQSGKAFISLAYNENDVFDVDLNNVPITIMNGSIDVISNASGDTSSGDSSGTRKPSGTSASSNPQNNIVTEQPKEQMILTIGKKKRWCSEKQR
ncbi:MAG: cohesin domain-containing protein [Clostridiales bacterium]|nr:cohesin domain-containing protein [Clostridiales bacterium]